MATTDVQQATDRPVGVTGAAGDPTWGSDLIMDGLRSLGIEYAAVLPGSTFRGIHDSAVNYTGNRAPEFILCNHEMITVSMARGYYRASGRPMAAIVHNVVGLLNTSMTIYDAWCDRVPVLVLGGTGPVDATQRRPWIDWIHTANVQGSFVRDITKWDDQPASVAAIPDSLLRAYRIAITEPGGPVYVCFDVSLQEQRLTEPVPLPDVSRYRAASPPAPHPDQVRDAARLLVGASFPLCFADRVGQHPEAVPVLVELAELLAMPVLSGDARMSFPTPHPLDFAGAKADLLRDADVVLGLDVVDLEGTLRLPLNPNTRAARSVAGRDQKVISISLDELAHNGLTTDIQALAPVDLPILASTQVALPMLLDECRRQVDAGARARIDQRRQAFDAQQAQLRVKQRQRVEQNWGGPQISESRLMVESWNAVKDEDFIFVYDHNRLRSAAPGVATLSGPAQYLGSGGGGAVGGGPGMALGAALALKGSGKLAIAVPGDGEMFASIQVLWTAAHYHIPTLWIVANNHSYYNDEDHQERIARIRGRPVENRTIAMRMQEPDVDFAAIARSFGLPAEGPITDAADLAPALKRAIAHVKEGQPALLDVSTLPRGGGGE